MCRETEKILQQTVCNGKSFACRAVTKGKVSGKILILMGFWLGSLPVVVHHRTLSCFWLYLHPPQRMNFDFSILLPCYYNWFFLLTSFTYLILLAAFSFIWILSWSLAKNEMNVLIIQTNEYFFALQPLLHDVLQIHIGHFVLLTLLIPGTILICCSLIMMCFSTQLSMVLIVMT